MLGQEDDLGRFAFTSASSHSQKASDLVWGLSTRNTVMPWSIQYPTTAASSSRARATAGFRSRSDRCPRSAWAGSRHSGSTHREGAGTMRGARAPGVVGRALERHVECHLDAAAPCGTQQGGKVLLRAELGVDGGVAPFSGPDGPRAPRVRSPSGPPRRRPCDWCADGWIGGRYTTSKPHGRHLVEARLDVGERAVAPPRMPADRGRARTSRKARPLGVGRTPPARDRRPRTESRVRQRRCSSSGA